MIETNEDFMELLHRACRETDSVAEMDRYLNRELYNQIPFDLVFKEFNI